MEIKAEAGGPSSKRRRSVSSGKDEDGGGVDHISALPGAVLGEIITLLPTKDGARTQILASRWRHIWRSAPLNLDCDTLHAGTISSILSSHPGPGRLFCLDDSCRETPASTLDAWLQSAALNNLEDIDFNYSHLMCPLLVSVFRFSETLRVATIGMCDLPYATVQGLHFPVLKQLGLDIVSMSDCSLQTMIARCPALECLMLHLCFGPSCLRINSLWLRRIGVRGSGSLNELVIESAPRLEALLHLDYSMSRVDKFLHVSILSAPKLETLLFSNSTRLVFGSTIIQGPHVNSLTLPVRTLKSLVLQLPSVNLSLDMVIELLRCFPCVEKLYIMCKSTGHRNPWRRKHRDLIKCLDIRLKKVVLEDYRGKDADKDFVTFFALNARALESMKLIVSECFEEFLEKQRTTKLQLENMAVNGARFHFTTHSGPSFSERLDVRNLDVMDPWK